MSNKYPEYIEGYEKFGRRICNVIVCKDCDEEWLLGEKNKDGTRSDKGHKIYIRKNPTLIINDRSKTNNEEMNEVIKEMNHKSGKL